MFKVMLVCHDYDFIGKFRCSVQGPFSHRAPLPACAEFEIQPALFGDKLSVVWLLASEGKHICFAKKPSKWCQMESLVGGS
jgi:hypothetical protein